MELVAEYREILDEQRRVAIGIPPETNMNGTWNEFHQLQDKVITVFAARGTGKSHNLALRAIDSPRDVTIFSINRSQAVVMRDYIANLLQLRGWNFEVRPGGGGHTIILGGRQIRIESSFRMRGISFTNEDILIDEFDGIDFRELRYVARQAAHIICVGTPRTAEGNAMNRWLMDSDRKMFIDSPYHYQDVSLQPLEIRPSILREAMGSW